MQMNKNLLIIRLDAIGDYILFRNFIKELKESRIYSKHKIYMLCNSSWYALAYCLDKEHIDQFIRCDLNEYRQNNWYKERLLKKLNACIFDTIIHPTYSRTFTVDSLVHKIKASYKIGYNGDLSNITREEKYKSDNFYTTLIPSTKEKIFEFERNKVFFEKVLNQLIKFKKPTLKLASNDVSDYVDPLKKYVVLSIGASNQKRKWNIDNYVKIAQFLIDEMNLEVVLCGGTLEVDDSKMFEYKIQRNFINLVNKISLYEASKIINKSLFVISNDTGLAHMAMALSKKTLVIMNGNHFGRFFPYPNILPTNFQCICPFDYENKFDEFKENFYNGSNININEIHYNKVISAIVKICVDDDYLAMSIKNKIQHHEVSTESPLLNYINRDIGIEFSKVYNKFYSQIQNFDNNLIVYGNGTIGKTIVALMADKIVGYVDMADANNHPKNLKNMEYDKIIISVLGREEEIIKYLVEDLKIARDKIITLEL